MGKLELRGGLSFVKDESNPFENCNIEELLEISRNFKGEVYDGVNKKIKAAILLDNSMIDLNILSGVFDNDFKEDFILLTLIIRCIIENNILVTKLPVFEYKDKIYSVAIQKLADINLELIQDSTALHYDIDMESAIIKTFSDEIKSHVDDGINYDRPYKWGIYSIDFTPFIYNPGDFTPSKGVLIRWVKVFDDD